jgi:hypothetical protein
MLDLEHFHALCQRAARETDFEILSEIRERMRELLLHTYQGSPRVAEVETTAKLGYLPVLPN